MRLYRWDFLFSRQVSDRLSDQNEVLLFYSSHSLTGPLFFQAEQRDPETKKRERGRRKVAKKLSILSA